MIMMIMMIKFEIGSFFSTDFQLRSFFFIIIHYNRDFTGRVLKIYGMDVKEGTLSNEKWFVESMSPYPVQHAWKEDNTSL